MLSSHLFSSADRPAKKLLPILFSLGIVLFCFAKSDHRAAQVETAEAKELKRLQGTWKMVYAEWDGMPLSREEIEDRRLIYRGDNYTMKVGNENWREGVVKLDVSKDPKRLEVKDRIETTAVIYLLADDIHIVCASSESKPKYPAKFTGEKGFWLAIYKRDKP